MSTVDNLSTFEYYLELYEKTQITISSTVNLASTIYTDDRDNMIANIIHSGSNYIYEGTKTISGNIILYDDINFVYIEDSFTSEDIENRFLIKPSHSLHYLINANKVTNATASGSIITTDLSSSSPYKIYINGNEIKSDQYTWNASGITLTSPYDGLITEISDDIIIYTYGNNQTISSGSLLLQYQSPQTLLPILADLKDGSYFTNYTTEICNFNSFDIQVDKSNNKINNIYQYMNFDKEVNRSSQFNITMFLDIRNTLQDNQFRILLFDKINEELVIFSNCIWNNGESKTYNMTKNEITYTINFEDEIEITYDGDYLAYGVGFYGAGTYSGSNLSIVNYRT